MKPENVFISSRGWNFICQHHHAGTFMFISLLYEQKKNQKDGPIETVCRATCSFDLSVKPHFIYQNTKHYLLNIIIMEFGLGII